MNEKNWWIMLIIYECPLMIVIEYKSKNQSLTSTISLSEFVFWQLVCSNRFGNLYTGTGSCVYPTSGAGTGTGTGTAMPASTTPPTTETPSSTFPSPTTTSSPGTFGSASGGPASGYVIFTTLSVP